MKNNFIKDVPAQGGNPEKAAGLRLAPD